MAAAMTQTTIDIRDTGRTVHAVDTVQSGEGYAADGPAAKPRRRKSTARPASRASGSPQQSLPPLLRVPLPAGRPREWYVTHNRRLKAMRLAIALLDTGVYDPARADNARIRAVAARVGVHPPSDTTCRMVRALIR